MPKIVDHQARRQEIAEKALPVLAREGIRDVTLAQVADACGIPRTTLYQSFRNMDALVDYVLTETFDLLDSAPLPLGAPQAPLDAIRQFLRHQVLVSLEHHDRMVLVLDQLFHPSRLTKGQTASAQDRVRKLREHLGRLLEVGVSSGALAPLDVEATAFALFALIEGATVHAVYYRDLLGDEAIDRFFSTVDRFVSSLSLA